MSDDRELLRLAAKAAGLPELTWDYEELRKRGHMVTRSMLHSPLDDDSAALRLANRLRISIGPEREDVIGQSLVRASWHANTNSLGEYGGGNYDVAMRRAIVRAAAEIGKAMP